MLGFIKEETYSFFSTGKGKGQDLSNPKQGGDDNNQGKAE